MESQTQSLEVLVLCASPIGDLATLKLPQELTKIENRLRKAQVPVRMTRVFPPTIEQLRRELTAMSQLGDQPGVFHFLGHGDDDGLYFENEFGESQLVKGSELKSALQESPVKLVLLNACWSATKRGVSLVEFLTREQVTETAIGHVVPVADESAIQFSERFYELVVSGKSVKVACQQAANALAETGLPGAADIKLVGNGELKLTDGLPISQRAFVSDDGMPTIGHLPDASVFFGRKEQLQAISRALSDSSLVGVGVWGIGGIGKTALALNAARRNAWRYRGTAWVDIREATQKTTVELLRIALGRLSPGANSDDPQHALSQFLKGTSSLIVLDNLEDLPESELPVLARFLKQLPRTGSHLLLTARVPLQPVEEVPDVTSIKLTEGLDGWHGPHYVQHVARQKKCAALQDELRLQHGELETTITDLQGLCVLVNQRLHGHPKMLELAVGLAMQGDKWLNDALTSLPEHLEDQLTPLLAVSVAALKEDGRKVLPYLRYFPTSELTFEALKVACGVGAVRSVDLPSESENNEVTWVGLGTQQLVSAGILDYQQTTDTFRFHQLIADNLITTPSGPHEGQVQNHLLGYYLKYLADNHDDDRMLSRCIREAMVYLERLWRQAQRPPDFDCLLAHSAEVVAGFAERQGFADVADTWNERSVSLFRLPHLSARRFGLAHALYRFGMGRIRRGDTELAEQCFHEAMGLLSTDRDSQTVSAIHHALAQLEQVRGNVPKAYEHAKASVELQNATTLIGSADGQNRIRGIHFLAILELQLRQVPMARQHFEEALRLAEEIGDDNGIAHISRELGGLERQHGDIDRGRRLLHRARESFEQSSGGRRDLHGLAATLNELGLLERHCGNFPEARRLFEQAIQIGASCHDRVREAE